jgi:hypothetical protein
LVDSVLKVITVLTALCNANVQIGKGMSMSSKLLKMTAAVAALSAVAAMGTAPANATYTFVGSWAVDQGPEWTTVPPAYSGVTAAELLFGPAPADEHYVTSTVDDLPADINFSAWISTWGGACGGAFPCGTVVGDTYVKSTGGLYASPGDTSTYVTDWAVGSQYTNYAFVATPEPQTWAMMLLGFAGLGFAGYRASRKSVAFSA